ncbi:MAG TPA: efflux transporter outer membrane subunit [Burkholderiales bacterium]|nr:efflux transporter outer membrane subunit [Burkholderiales bacterium]
MNVQDTSRALASLSPRRLAVPALLLMLAGCVVGPDYKRPETGTPKAWKESNQSNATAAALPATWWEVFGDTKLNELEDQAKVQSPNLRAAAARVMQARAIARVSEADFYPDVTLDPGVSRDRYSENRPVQPNVPVVGYTANHFRLPLDASYEIDVWGRVRRAVESADARLEASADDYFTVLLTLQADIAQNYFALRSLDAERDVLRRAIEIRRQALELISVRYEGGIGSELDVTRAKTEVASAESESISVSRRRAEIEHAIAVLIGRPPAEFGLAENPLNLAPPAIPAGLPSELLVRRPDVAQAERLLAARNAEIGVAKAAYFPSIRLTGALGFDSAELGDLLKSGSRAGFLGAGVSLPIFDGGRIKGNVDLAKAVYEENLAQYRGRVLGAFGEVEDALSGLRILAEQADAQARALASAQQTAEISTTRYEAGLVIFLEVVDAERTRLATQQLATQIDGQRLVASVGLIKALGGGWQEANRGKILESRAAN